MSLRLTAQCYLCHFRRNVELAERLGTEETATAFAKDLMALYLSAPESAGSPWLGPGVNALFQKHYGLGGDRFLTEKRLSNQYVLSRMDALRQRLRRQPDPVFAALQLAVLGNYIDFAALMGEVRFETLDVMLETAFDISLDRDAYESLCRDCETGNRLLYLTDNAGEIGFDRLFAETLHEAYPKLAITFCVRGAPAANDATREDAAAVGIPFPVIDNGNTVAGTELSLLGAEAKTAFESADVIISKGQGNAETLLGCGYNVYYAFLVKCPRFITRFQKPKLTPMLVKEKTALCQQFR